MPLTVFEAYFIDGELNGYPQEHWDAVIEQWDGLVGDPGGSDALFYIGRHTELALKFQAWHTAIDGVIMCLRAEAFEIAAPLCELLAKQFRGCLFTRETAIADIETARSRLKATELLIKETRELLPKEEQSNISSTFFDDILYAYREVFTAPTDAKKDMTVQSFAVAYKRLKDKIEKDRQNTANNG